MKLVLVCMDSYDSESRHILKFFEIYEMCIPVHRSGLKISTRNASQMRHNLSDFEKLFIQNLAKFWLKGFFS